MNIKIRRNHRFECSRLYLVVDTLLWQSVILAKRFTHGAEHLPELLEHLQSISQRVRDRAVMIYLISQSLLEMIRRYLKLLTRFLIRFVQHPAFVSIHFVRVIQQVMARLHMESLKHWTPKHRGLASISISIGLHQSEWRRMKISELHLLSWSANVRRFR